jgi:hypothetical protein
MLLGKVYFPGCAVAQPATRTPKCPGAFHIRGSLRKAQNNFLGANDLIISHGHGSNVR